MFTFCPLNLAWATKDLDQAINELSQLPASAWYLDDFRQCYILPIYTESGKHIKGNVAGKVDPLQWTPWGEQLPTLQYLVSSSFMNLLSPMGRFFLLKTPPHASIATHIDCAHSETVQHQIKLRYVLQGPTDSLFFLNEDESKTYAPIETPCYIMDGGHPHGLENRSSNDKITLCIGSPWSGNNLPRHLLNQRLAFNIQKPTIKPEWCDLKRLESIS